MTSAKAAVFLAALAAAPAATLTERIDAALAQPVARRALWGVKVLDLESGKTLYQSNAERLFTPASNTKLFSTALGLVRLGPGHRYLTRVAASAAPDANGRIAGDVILIGGGDPNLSSRVLPYQQRNEFLPTALEPIEDLASQIAALGVRQIDGDIVGDDTYYVWQRYAGSWNVDDTVNSDGPPISAVVINDNILSLRIRPGQKAGDPALVRMEPPVSYYRIDNRIRTVAAPAATRRIRINREPGDPVVHLSGEIRLNDPGRADTLSIDDPAWFAAEALREALERRSVTILGKTTSRHALPWELEDLELGKGTEPAYAVVLASRSSMPLIEDLRLTNKISQNLHAELIQREVARQRRGIGSFEASRAELQAFLTEIGIPAQSYFFRDGSGLSRMNLVSPTALVALLSYMWRSPHRELWMDTLPVGGSDGTLSGRFSSVQDLEIRAKTGTLTHVSALSGYFLGVNGRSLAFSILVNNSNDDTRSLQGVIDQICLSLAEN